MIQQNEKPYKLTIVATAFNEQPHNRMFIDSMLNQTCQDYNAIIYHNGPDESCWYYTDALDKKFQYKESSINSGNWGTANRQTAIDKCDTEYILNTSIQDIWLSQAVEYITKTIDRTGADLILWNSVNHLIGPCKELDSKLEWSKVDWGNFCLKTSIARQVRIKQEQYCADWYFISDLIQAGLLDEKKIIKLPYILTIHN